MALDQWPLQRSMYALSLSEAMTANGTKWTPAAFGSEVRSASRSRGDGASVGLALHGKKARRCTYYQALE